MQVEGNLILIGKTGIGELNKHAGGKPQCKSALIKSNRTWFASLLLHEWYHIYGQKGLSDSRTREIDAWNYQTRFLNRYRDKLKRIGGRYNGMVRKFLEGHVSYATKMRLEYILGKE
jgi:hypothetical protein